MIIIHANLASSSNKLYVRFLLLNYYIIYKSPSDAS